jgi:hypothetical protein
MPGPGTVRARRRRPHLVRLLHEPHVRATTVLALRLRPIRNLRLRRHRRSGARRAGERPRGHAHDLGDASLGERGKNRTSRRAAWQISPAPRARSQRATRAGSPPRTLKLCGAGRVCASLARSRETPPTRRPTRRAPAHVPRYVRQFPGSLGVGIGPLRPTDDRMETRRVVPRFGPDRFRTARERACRTAGVPTLSTARSPPPPNLPHCVHSLVGRIGEAVG